MRLIRTTSDPRNDAFIKKAGIKQGGGQCNQAKGWYGVRGNCVRKKMAKGGDRSALQRESLKDFALRARQARYGESGESGEQRAKKKAAESARREYARAKEKGMSGKGFAQEMEDAKAAKRNKLKGSGKARRAQKRGQS